MAKAMPHTHDVGITGLGLPVLGIDAAANADDSYATVVTAPDRECHYIHAHVSTHAAIISLDGGTTDHFVIPASVEPHLFSGLKIPAGTVIKGKNLTVASDYANLRISVW